MTKKAHHRGKEWDSLIYGYTLKEKSLKKKSLPGIFIR
jgi:hypothetical protein